MNTAKKHPVPDCIKPSFVILDIRTLWCSTHMVTVGVKGLNATIKKQKTQNTAKKLPWFSRLLQHSASKQDGLILQCSRAHTRQSQSATSSFVRLVSTTIQQKPWNVITQQMLLKNSS